MHVRDHRRRGAAELRAMVVRPGKGWRGAEQNRALQMLAGSPLGCTEVIMLAHGFTVEILERFVLDGLATPAPGTVHAGAAAPNFIMVREWRFHQGQTVLVTEPDGQVIWPSERGLYFRDTRVISAWAIFADGEPSRETADASTPSICFLPVRCRASVRTSPCFWPSKNGRKRISALC
jgi:hypothetical protein